MLIVCSVLLVVLMVGAVRLVGAIQIKNWRALDLEYVTDNALASVDDMLGDLTTVATLRIKISR